jgi:AcrR family transcriptional regulator
MTKSTFNNLSDEKKEVILHALKKEFELYPIHEASVSSIVKRAGISRGSFYQYFENLEYSFFTILELEIVGIHDIFINLMRQEKGDLFSALKLYGDVLIDEIFKKEKYNLYRNRYLYWNCELEEKWKDFRKRGSKDHIIHSMYLNSNDAFLQKEVTNFLNALIKKLIESLFIEEWDQNTFLKHYDQYINWIEHGLGTKEELYGTF